ncbi:hypothetical protein [Streptomyces sp. MAR4 CNX-425]|uniref:hypothetical protein n=1 Tax=Streptomyces sp. MAR4 CNX-425 TaxID=3406343 RepID=UPI003B50EB6D
MTADGLEYLPEGFRDGARRNADTADAAEGTRRYLGNVPISTGAYGGAAAFPAALTDTRDTQARSIGRAAEGRNGMAAADNQVAATGDDMDTGAAQALGGVPVRTVDTSVVDGL